MTGGIFLTGFALKIIALISMVIDHTLKAGFIHQGTLMEWFGMDIPGSYRLITFIEALGRLAFPIFAFMIAEGLRHTRSRRRYITQLLLFGVVSELPFDLVLVPLGMEDVPWYAFLSPITDLNVFFTLALGALGIALTDHLAKNEMPKALLFLPAAACALIGALFNVDYSLFGVLMIYSAYFLKGRAIQLLGMAAIQFVLYFGYLTNWTFALSSYVVVLYLAACIPLLLLALYNGQRGRKCKWLFYIFYPAHLTLLIVLRFAFLG